AVLAARPAARSAHAFLQFFLGSPDAAFARFLLLGVFDPADELVARQRRDVLPRRERGGVADQCGSQVRGQLVHDAARHSLAAHEVRVAADGSSVPLSPPIFSARSRSRASQDSSTPRSTSAAPGLPLRYSKGLSMSRIMTTR